MKNLAFVIFAFTVCLSLTARATIYIVAADANTKSVGMVAVSSGPVVTYSPHAMNGVKGVGFTGWSGSAMNISTSMDKKVFEMMQKGQTPEAIASYVDSQIHEKYSRYSFISVQGTLGYVFPPKGCGEPE